MRSQSLSSFFARRPVAHGRPLCVLMLATWAVVGGEAIAQQAADPAASEQPAQREAPPAGESPAGSVVPAAGENPSGSVVPAAGEAPAQETGDTAATGKLALPRLTEMPLPTAEELLRGPRLDWVVLKGDEQHVLITEPVTPRPDTLAKMTAALDERLKERKNLRAEALDQYRRELEEMAHINLVLPAQFDESAYQIHMDKVAQVIHHEDLMLRRIDALIRDQNFELAYELLNALRRKTPDWPGAAERHSDFLLAEARRRHSRGQTESALATLEEIYERNATFKGLTDTAGAVVDDLIADAIQAGDWRRARHFLNRLARMYPQHPTVQNRRADLQARAEHELAEAESARSGKNHALAARKAETAASIWPQTRNLRTRYRVFADRYQRLNVGVLDLPSSDERDPVLSSRADRRSDQLQQLTFFRVDNANDGSAHYSSAFCDRWEPWNLGREAVFELRDNRQPWEMQPVITAPTVAAHIAERLTPESPQYDERLAGYASSVDVDSPYSFMIRFHRVPVRTEALLTIPISSGAATGMSAASVGGESEVSLEAESVMQGGFTLAEVNADGAVYQRSLPEPEGLRQYHLAEIQEHRYDDFGAVLQALLRGDVSLVPNLPPRDVERLRRDEALLKDFFVQRMAVPLTHVVQLHPRSAPLKNRELRRALMYGIDRPTILNEQVLDGAPADLGRVVTGPFPSASYANSALADQRKYDPVSAISLTLAARKQFGGSLPPLRMLVVDEPIAQRAAQQLVESWKRFGIEVTIIPAPSRLNDPDSATAEWDLLYRTVQLVEPVVDLWPFLTLTGRAQVSDLDPFPDWLRQEIINLDLVGDWRTAVLETQRLHLHLWSEVMVIPLWEVDQYLVYRKNIRGVPVAPVLPYDAIDRWIVESWYPAEEP